MKTINKVLIFLLLAVILGGVVWYVMRGTPKPVVFKGKPILEAMKNLTEDCPAVIDSADIKKFFDTASYTKVIKRNEKICSYQFSTQEKTNQNIQIAVSIRPCDTDCESIYEKWYAGPYATPTPGEDLKIGSKNRYSTNLSGAELLLLSDKNALVFIRALWYPSEGSTATLPDDLTPQMKALGAFTLEKL